MLRCERPIQSAAITATISAPALASATRHDEANAIGTSIAGASAQPRLPVTPCTAERVAEPRAWICG